MTNNGKFFLQQQEICLLIKVKDFDRIKTLLKIFLAMTVT